MSNTQEKMEVITSDTTYHTTDVTFIGEMMKSNGYGDGKDLAYFAINHSARRTLPYGIWTCSDGREILFNREYQPIMQRKDGVRSYVDRNEWIDNATIDRVQYLFDDGNSPVLYLTKHLGRDRLSAAESRQCKKTLLICLKVLRDFTPKEHGSVNRGYSLAKYE